jgi:hypothetical protein
MDVEGTTIADIDGTLSMALDGDGGRSQAAGTIKILGPIAKGQLDVKLIDLGNGTTYVRAPGVGSSARPWREVTTFGPRLSEGVAGIIAHTELLNSVLFDPRQYIEAKPVGLAGAFAFKADQSGALRASCQQNLCDPGQRFQDWTAKHAPRWLSIDMIMKLSAENQLERFEVHFEYGDGRDTAVVRIRARIDQVGKPVSVAAPPDAQISR